MWLEFSNTFAPLTPPEPPMRAEPQKLVDAIEEQLALLRRSL
jgi:hypothetical protein